jgi:hypothetical protein
MKTPKEKLDSKGNLLPTVACPVCLYMMDCASSLEPCQRPRPGDFSLCLKCGAILRFQENFHLRAATEFEIRFLPDKERKVLLEAQMVIRAMPTGIFCN